MPTDVRVTRDLVVEKMMSFSHPVAIMDVVYVDIAGAI